MLETTSPQGPGRTGRARVGRTVRASLRFERLIPRPIVDDAADVLTFPDGGRARWGAAPLRAPILARARWSSTEPSVVTVRFRTDRLNRGQAVVWVFCPQMLRAGLDGPVGIGDVSVLPDPFRPSVADLVLSTDSGHVCLRFSRAELAGFLDRIPVGYRLTDDAAAAQLADVHADQPGRGDPR